MASYFVEEIDNIEIEKIQLIGKGSFGDVFLARWRENKVAVKEIKFETGNSFSIEVRQMSRVNHPNIIKLYGVSLRNPCFIVMEYADGGSLYNYLHCNPKRPYTASHAMSWAKQTAEGVAYLHSMKPKPLIHRDLKPPNLLLNTTGTIIKICDFGTVTDKSTYMTNSKGSAAWMAPEVFEGSMYTEKCDVFSWGIILWEVLSREQPFKNIEHTYGIMWHVHKGNRPNLIDGCPKPIETLMVSCWDANPSIRPSMSEVVDIMNELSAFFPGADEPLPMDVDYQDDMEDDYYTNYTNSNLSNISNTNMSRQSSSLFKNTKVENSVTPTNSIPSQNYLKSNFLSPATGAQWASQNSSSPEIVVTSYQDEFKQRSVTLPQMPNFQPISLDIDPNAWELPMVDLRRALEETDSNNQGTQELDVKRLIGNRVDSSTKITYTNSTMNANSQVQQGKSTNAQETDNFNNNVHNPPSRFSRNDLDLETMMELLDPHLKPITPLQNNAQSQQIFNEHKELAQEYLMIQTEIAYLTQQKEELITAMAPEERDLRLDYYNKLKEKEALLELERNLRKQLESVKNPNRNQNQQDSQQPNNDGWIIINPNQS